MLNKNIRLLGVIAMLWGCIMTGQAKNYDDKADTCRFVTNSFWDNWFIQAGVGMSLQNVYGKDFTNVFPKGNTFGVNVGFGMWFSPEMGLRLGANWQNSIVRNKNAYYLSAMDEPGEKRTTAKLEGGHNWPRFLFNTGASAVVAFGGKTLLKNMIKEERPDHSDNKSFPSGHAAIAFAAARSIDKEFRRDNIWIPIAGYAAATAVGIERIASKRHYWYDVAAGAAVGIGAAELTWWLSDKMFGKGSNLAVGSSGNTVDVTYNF